MTTIYPDNPPKDFNEWINYIHSQAILGKNVAYITPTYQLARVFFERLIKSVPFESNKSELSIKFPNDGSVEFFTGERLDNLRGRKFHLVVIDEASKDFNEWINYIHSQIKGPSR